MSPLRPRPRRPLRPRSRVRSVSCRRSPASAARGPVRPASRSCRRLRAASSTPVPWAFGCCSGARELAFSLAVRNRRIRQLALSSGKRRGRQGSTRAGDVERLGPRLSRYISFSTSCQCMPIYFKTHIVGEYAGFSFSVFGFFARISPLLTAQDKGWLRALPARRPRRRRGTMTNLRYTPTRANSKIRMPCTNWTM